MKKTVWIAATAAVLMTFGCKSKREKLGDEHLAAGRYGNAISMYNKAEAKGDISEEFNDSYSMALLGQMNKSAEKGGATQDVIHAYFETLPKYIDGSTKPETAEQYVQTLMAIGKAKIATGDFTQKVQAFNFFKEAKRVTEEKGVGKSFYEADFKKAEAEVIASAMSTKDGEPVVAEYYLLEAQKLLPESEEIKGALSEVRAKNLSNFLIWSLEMNGVQPSPLIDVNGWLFAFRKGEYSKSAKALNGYIEIWNSTNNNSKLTDPSEIKLYSVDGKSVDNTKPLAKQCARIDTEKDCTTPVSFSYDSDFTPLYIEIRNSEGSGKKYLPID